MRLRRSPIASASAFLRAIALCLLVLGGNLAPHGALAQTADDLEPDVMREVVEGVARAVADEYFDPAVGATVGLRLDGYLGSGRYDTLRTREALASALTRDLFEATSDKHLAVMLVSAPTSAPASESAREERGRRENFGVREATVLPGNIGYLNVTSFYRANEAGGAIAEAMKTLAGAEALIIDMRQNGGGAPDTVSLLAGYLFDTPGKPLFDIVDRSGERRQYATPQDQDLPRNERRPVFVLTSARTFSAGEGLAFILQDERRATIVGERTAGAANPGRAYPAGHGFEVIVPNGSVQTARSGRNWEGMGVVPDVMTPADAARDRAYEMARTAARP